MSSHVAAQSAAPGWLDRLFAWRDRLIASDAFRRRAAAFPLTRPLARKAARDLFDLCAGFVYSQILLACVRLDVFRMLADGPLPLAVLAERTGLDEEAALRLARAGVALGLFAWRGEGRVGLGQLGAAMVGNEALTAMVEHHALLYADLEDPVALLRGKAGATRLSSYWPYAADRAREGVEAGHAVEYSKLMSASQPLIAEELLDAFPFKRPTRLLDIGGGEGRFALAAARRHPHLQVSVFDLPAVAERARAQFAAHGIADRASAHGGNFFTDALPTGADVVSLIRVMFDHDDASVLAILGNVRALLPESGTLVIAEPLAATRGALPMGDAYFGFYLLAMGRGRSRTAEELGALLRRAGFTRVRPVATRMPLQTGILIAKP
jgi:demethylspheroidene O-methyltransferase